jgi:dihydrofolate reductase
MITLILACDSKWGISKDGNIPWYSKKDLSFFRKITTNKIIVMGKKTWESLPIKPLPNRINIVISKTLKGDFIYDTPEKVIEKYKNEDLVIIGGAEIYKWFFENCKIDTIYLTEVCSDFDCDTFVDFLKNTPFEIIETFEENRIIYNLKKNK